MLRLGLRVGLTSIRLWERNLVLVCGARRAAICHLCNFWRFCRCAGAASARHKRAPPVRLVPLVHRRSRRGCVSTHSVRTFFGLVRRIVFGRRAVWPDRRASLKCAHSLRPQMCVCVCVCVCVAFAASAQNERMA